MTESKDIVVTVERREARGDKGRILRQEMRAACVHLGESSDPWANARRQPSAGSGCRGSPR